MNGMELQEARQFLRLQEDLKDPAKKLIYEYAQRRAKEEKRRKEILDSWGPYGYRPPALEPQPKQKTEAEIRRENILKNYS